MTTTYAHLRRAVDLGLIRYEMVPGRDYGVSGFRSFHPIQALEARKDNGSADHSQ